MEISKELEKEINDLVKSLKRLSKPTKYRETALVVFGGQEINVPISYSLVWESDVTPTIELSKQNQYYPIVNMERLITGGNDYKEFEQKIRELVSSAEKLSLQYFNEEDYIWYKYLDGAK